MQNPQPGRRRPSTFQSAPACLKKPPQPFQTAADLRTSSAAAQKKIRIFSPLQTRRGTLFFRRGGRRISPQTVRRRTPSSSPKSQICLLCRKALQKSLLSLLYIFWSIIIPLPAILAKVSALVKAFCQKIALQCAFLRILPRKRRSRSFAADFCSTPCTAALRAARSHKRKPSVGERASPCGRFFFEL